MTREEAITQLEILLEYCESMMTSEYPVWRRDCEALQMLIAALRPVSREQVEKVFPGCALCNWGGLDFVGVDEDGIYLSKPTENEKFRFCPACGRPLTDEAVEMVMERLEALKDGKDD